MDEVKLKKTLAEWQEVYVGIQELMQESLPVRESYWLARNLDRIEGAVKSLDTLRKKLLDEFSDKDENGQPIMTPAPEGLPGMQYSLCQNGLKFQQAWLELMNQEIEISIFPISIEKIADKLDNIKPSILKGALCLFIE
jgi:hypothetical protein